jgi:hypothetical protein
MEETTNRPLRQRIGSFFTSLTGVLTSTAALVGAVVGILTAVGVIGGGSGGTHSASSAPSRATWAAKANAICADANEATAALPDPHTVARSDIAAYLKTSAMFERRMLRKLNALTPPNGQEANVASFLDVGARMSDATSELADDAALGDLAGMAQRASQLSRLNTRFNNAAIAVGARTCAEGSSVTDIFGG